MIVKVITNIGKDNIMKQVQEQVQEMCRKHPVPELMMNS